MVTQRDEGDDQDGDAQEGDEDSGQAFPALPAG